MYKERKNERRVKTHTHVEIYRHADTLHIYLDYKLVYLNGSKCCIGTVLNIFVLMRKEVGNKVKIRISKH